MEEEDLCAVNRNKRKFQDETLEVRMAKHTCFCLSAKDSNSVMSVSDDAPQSHSSSSSSSVNWTSQTKACDDHSASSFPDCELSVTSSSEEEDYETKQSMEDLFCSNAVVVISNHSSVLSSGRWNVNQDAEPGTEKLTIDKEFEQYFSMLML